MEKKILLLEDDNTLGYVLKEYLQNERISHYLV